MREDPENHLGMFDGSDDLQACASAWATFDVHFECPFGQARLSLMRAGASGLRGASAIVASVIGVDGLAWNDLGP